MADFLTRLAGRTLGVVPTVQPMIAPLYAPDSALLAAQASLPVFEEVSGGAADQPSHWPAGRESIDLPGREPLKAAPTAQGQEERANLFANPVDFSLRQDRAFPPAGMTQSRAMQPALPPRFGGVSTHSQHTPPSIFATGEGGQQGAHLSPSSIFTTGEEGVPGTTHHISFSSISMTNEAAQPRADIPLPSQLITREGGQQGGDLSVSLPAAPLPAPDKTGSLQTREVHALPSQPVQEQSESASFTRQEYQGSDVPYTVINVNSVERQRAAGNPPQSVLPANSRSRASIRRAAADALTNRHELSQEETAPTTPAAPTIQVTIGRIEVRATQPPPPQRQAPRPGPRMVSLEEYLNQQAKGGQ